jgi:hypothetical protein
MNHVRLTAALGLLLMATAAKADGQAKKIEIIKFEDAPAAVRNAIEARFPGAKVSTTERETENGKVVFEISLTHEHDRYELHIQDVGAIEAIEKEINLKDVPEAVLAAVTHKNPAATIETASEVSKVEGKEETLDHYLVAVKIGDKKREIPVSLDGKAVK